MLSISKYHHKKCRMIFKLLFANTGGLKVPWGSVQRQRKVVSSESSLEMQAIRTHKWNAGSETKF